MEAAEESSGFHLTSEPGMGYGLSVANRGTSPTAQGDGKMARETKAQKEAREAEEAAAAATEAEAETTETGEDAGTEGEGAETTEADGDARKSSGPSAGSMPTYKVERMELPDEDVRASNQGRKLMYANLLNTVVEDEDSWGEWFAVATFKTPGGAREAEKAIEKGERVIPDGEWEFAVRKIANEDNETGKRWSRLFARYMGEGEITEDAGDDEDSDEDSDD